MSAVAVRLEPEGTGWLGTVEVTEGGSQTVHQVRVSRTDLARLQPGATDPEALLRETFGFLLEHESKESILRTFDLPVVSRYFPEFETEIRRRLATVRD